MRLRGKTDRMEVVLDTEASTVTVIQRWKCNFLTYTSREQWQEEEMRNFRRQIHRVIDEVWGSKAYVYPLPEDNRFYEQYSNKTFIIKVKIEFVRDFEDWSVDIYKARPNELEDWNDAHVDWANKKIRLTSHATTEYKNKPLESSTSPGSRYWIAAHEFGHAMGYVGPFADEYTPGNPQRFDTLSVMNIGSEVRKRHFETVCSILDSLSDNKFGFRML